MDYENRSGHIAFREFPDALLGYVDGLFCGRCLKPIRRNVAVTHDLAIQMPECGHVTHLSCFVDALRAQLHSQPDRCSCPICSRRLFSRPPDIPASKIKFSILHDSRRGAIELQTVVDLQDQWLETPHTYRHLPLPRLLAPPNFTLDKTLLAVFSLDPTPPGAARAVRLFAGVRAVAVHPPSMRDQRIPGRSQAFQQLPQYNAYIPNGPIRGVFPPQFNPLDQQSVPPYLLRTPARHFPPTPFNPHASSAPAPNLPAQQPSHNQDTGCEDPMQRLSSAPSIAAQDPAPNPSRSPTPPSPRSMREMSLYVRARAKQIMQENRDRIDGKEGGEEEEVDEVSSLSPTSTLSPALTPTPKVAAFTLESTADPSVSAAPSVTSQNHLEQQKWEAVDQETVEAAWTLVAMSMGKRVLDEEERKKLQ